MPRKTRLTPELRDRVAQAVRDGNFLEPAARANGVSHSTLHLWLSNGRKGKQPYLDFLDIVERAEAEAELLAVTQLTRSFPSSWRASVRWLESHAAGRWRPRDLAPPATVVLGQQMPNAGVSVHDHLDSESIGDFLRRNPDRLAAAAAAMRSLKAAVDPSGRDIG